jgi:hypothetical protein
MVIKRLIDLGQDHTFGMLNVQKYSLMAAFLHFASPAYIELAAAVDLTCKKFHQLYNGGNAQPALPKTGASFAVAQFSKSSGRAVSCPTVFGI